MATVTKLKTKAGQVRYKARVRITGYPVVNKTFPRKTDAHAWAAQVEKQIEDGTYFDHQERKRNTVSVLVDRYLDTVLPDKKPSTQRDQVRQLAWWKREIGDTTLDRLRPALIAEKRDKLAKDRSGSTVNRYLAALSHVCTVASSEWHLLEDNPVRKVRKRPEPRGRVRFLDDKERAALLEHTDASPNPYLHAIVTLALSTGMRHGEVMNLTWNDVDLSRRVIVLGDTKNGERRAVPLIGEALSRLRELRRTPRIDTDLLFPGYKDPSKPMDIRAAWEKALEDAGVEDFVFHDLRHTAASYLAMQGATTSEIAAVLGHKTLAMVQRYAHLSEQHTVGVLERMNAAVFGNEAKP